MAFEQKELSGALFRNAKRDKDTQPNATGTALIGGVLYYVSAWTKDTKSGDKYQSLSFKRKDEVQGTAIKEAKEILKTPDFDDDIPFN